MASVFAIISKGMFEKQCKSPKLGAVFDTDRYVSTQPRLEVLAKGGSLFLVTVRPPNEALWLVAVLEKPTAKDGAWVAAKNVAPMTLIDDLKKQLRFDNGAGIAAKPGALGMSLQTPRLLTEADVALLRAKLAPPSAVSEQAASAAASAPRARAALAAPRTLREACEHTRWVALGPSRQERLARTLERASQGALRYVRMHGFGGASVAVFLHEPSGLALHLVPGGPLERGLGADEHAALLAQLGDRDDAATARAFLASAALRPPRAVYAPAALLAARPLDAVQLDAVLRGERAGGATVASLRRLRTSEYAAWLRAPAPARVARARVGVLEAALAALGGLRLPSEAEWECAARAGGRAPFVDGTAKLPERYPEALGASGLAGLAAGFELCADAWSPRLDDAPADGSPRAASAPNAPRAVRGGALAKTPWSAGDAAWRWLLCAARRPDLDAGNELVARPALSLPA